MRACPLRYKSCHMNKKLYPRFVDAIKKFNGGDFYACHDLLEDIWFEITGTERNFYQGLIHAAVGFHHIIDKKNPRGALLQLNKAIAKLKPFEPVHETINLRLLLREVEACIKEIEKIHTGKKKNFNRKLIPRITLKKPIP